MVAQRSASLSFITPQTHEESYATKDAITDNRGSQRHVLLYNLSEGSLRKGSPIAQMDVTNNTSVVQSACASSIRLRREYSSRAHDQGGHIAILPDPP